MPRQPSVLRRLSAAGLVLPLLVWASPPASAAPFTGSLTKSQGFFVSGSGCTVSSNGLPPSGTPLSGNVTTSLNNVGAETLTGPTAGDTGQLTASVIGTVRMTETATGVTAFDLNAALKAKVVRTLGESSACDGNASVGDTINGQFTLPSARVLDLTVQRTGAGRVQSTFRIQDSGGDYETWVETSGHPGTTNHLVVVPAATYQLFNSTQVEATSFVPGLGVVDARLVIHAAFAAPGSARHQATGPAAKYLALAGGQSCAAHTLAVDFTRKAGPKPPKGGKPRIAKATFFVNGSKVKTARKPNKNTSVVLGALPASGPVTVSAVLQLTGKGKVAVSRDYYPCG